MALVIDRAAEDAIFAELEALGVAADRRLGGARRGRDRRRRPDAGGDRPGRRVAERQARPAAAARLDRGRLGSGDARRRGRAGRRARQRARVVGGARRGRLPRRRAAASRSSPGRWSCSASRARRPSRVAAAARRAARAGGPPHARARVGRAQPLPGGGRPARRDDEPAPDALGRRRRGPADRPRGRRRRRVPRHAARTRALDLDMRSHVVAARDDDASLHRAARAPSSARAAYGSG